MSVPAADLGRLRRRVFWLEGASMAWTAAGAAAAITAGVITSSIAIVGLGLDSAVNLLAAVLVVWQLRRIGEDHHARALGLIAITFLVGNTYVLAQSVHELASHSRSGRSGVDVAVAAATLVVLPVLAFAKRRTGQALSNGALLADASETATGGLAAAAALLGVGVHAWWGWWWADPAAGLAIAVVAVAGAVETWRHHH